MENQPADHLEILALLAREYQQKYEELEEFLRQIGPEDAIQQLRLRAELSTDHFRGAQQALLAGLVSLSPENGGAELTKAATAACRSFDEIRILFQMLLDYSSKSE